MYTHSDLNSMTVGRVPMTSVFYTNLML